VITDPRVRAHWINLDFNSRTIRPVVSNQPELIRKVTIYGSDQYVIEFLRDGIAK
jgi:hypothetical protein